jgi:hypothetical protein
MIDLIFALLNSAVFFSVMGFIAYKVVIPAIAAARQHFFATEEKAEAHTKQLIEQEHYLQQQLKNQQAWRHVMQSKLLQWRNAVEKKEAQSAVLAQALEKYRQEIEVQRIQAMNDRRLKRQLAESLLQCLTTSFATPDQTTLLRAYQAKALANVSQLTAQELEA